MRKRYQTVVAGQVFYKIASAIREVKNQYEIGGMLVGHHINRTFYVLDITVAKSENPPSAIAFSLNGEEETKKTSTIMAAYKIQPRPIGVWHSHIWGNASFSEQDKSSNIALSRCLNGAISMLALPNLTQSQGMNALNRLESWYISPQGQEQHCAMRVKTGRIPGKLMQKRRYITQEL